VSWPASLAWGDGSSRSPLGGDPRMHSALCPSPPHGDFCGWDCLRGPSRGSGGTFAGACCWPSTLACLLTGDPWRLAGRIHRFSLALVSGLCTLEPDQSPIQAIWESLPTGHEIVCWGSDAWMFGSDSGRGRLYGTGAFNALCDPRPINGVGAGVPCVVVLAQRDSPPARVQVFHTNHSVCFRPVPKGRRSIGYARVVSDRAPPSAISPNVFVCTGHGAGCGKCLRQAACFSHPELQGVRRLVLATMVQNPLRPLMAFNAFGGPAIDHAGVRPRRYKARLPCRLRHNDPSRAGLIPLVGAVDLAGVRLANRSPPPDSRFSWWLSCARALCRPALNAGWRPSVASGAASPLL